MKRHLGIVMFAGALILAAHGPAVAALPAPPDLPGDAVVLGNARVQAFLSLRLDLDSLNHGDVHPALVHQWLAVASREVLEGIARQSADVELVLDAARQLVRQKPIDISFFRRLATQWQESPRSPQFDALRIMAGDSEFTKTIESRLNTQGDGIRIHGAQILALAGRQNGFDALRRHLEQCGTEVSVAARVFAETATEKELPFLAAQYAGRCPDNGLKMAMGEIRMRSLFSPYYELLVRRDPWDTRAQAPNGMYAAWFDLVMAATERGAKSAGELVAFVRQFRQPRELWPTQAEEVSRRNVDAFAEFLENAAQRIRTKEVRVSWPATFSEAMAQLAVTSGEGFSKRVGAAFAILSWTEQLAQSNGTPVKEEFSSLTPMGHRVSDRSWNSSFRSKKGGRLVLEWAEPQSVDELWLAAGCADEPSTGLTEILLTVVDSKGTPSRKIGLNPNARFFQPVAMHQNGVRQIVIEISGTAGDAPVCITEIRAFSKPRRP